MKQKKVFLFSGVLLVVALFLSFMGVVKPQTTQSNTQQNQLTKSDVAIAIVNEDSGTIYNEDKVTMANVLIESFVKTAPYKVETVSRAIAEKGLENGTYQVMVIMPSHFSQAALSLEEVEPQRALFQYKIKADKQVLVKQAEQAVSDLKQKFNQDMIRIYFSSIIGNLQTAQHQVSGVVKNQGDTSQQFHASLLEPLTQYSQQFTGLSSASQNAQNMLEGLNTNIQNSNTAFTQIISVDKTYGPEIAAIKSLQDEWTKSVLNRETLLKSYDDSILKLTVDPQLKALNEINTVRLPVLNANESFKTITANALELNTRLDVFTTDIANRNQEVNTYLATTYKDRIKQAVAKSLSEKDNTKQTLGMLVTGLRNNINTQIQTSAQNLVLYDDATIDRMPISNTDKQFLKNTVRFVQQLNTTATLETKSNYDQFIETKEMDIKNQIVTGQVTIKDIKGDIQNITLNIDDRYDVKVIRIDGQEVSFAKVANGIEVTSGFTSTASQLSIAYELSHKDISVDNNGWFTPIVSTIDVNTKESVAHLSTAELQTLTGQIAAINTSIQESNHVINAFNTYQQSGTNTPQTFNQLAPIDVASLQLNPSTQTIDRIYRGNHTTTLFTDSNQFIRDFSPAVYNDMKSYLDFAGQVKSVYGLDLYTNQNANPNRPAAGSLYDQLALERLDEILVDLVTVTLTDDVKEKLVIPVEWTTEVNGLKTDIEALNVKITEFQTLMTQVNGEISSLLSETEKVKQTLASKPQLVEAEKRDNTDFTEVTLLLDRDLSTLMQASRTLLENTKNHQADSESIRQEYNRLNEQVKGLEEKGTEYKTTVETMNSMMAQEYTTNSEFLKAFTQVMENTKTGNTDNTIVYDYLSNPVQGTLLDNQLTGGATTRQQLDNRTGVLTILIISMLTLAFVYMLKHGDWQIVETSRYLSGGSKTVLSSLGLLGAQGAIIGILVSMVVGIKLNLPINQLLVLIGVAIIIGISFVFMHFALIAWLKAYGLLISLSFVVIYLISLGQLFDTFYGSVTPIITYLTPLIPAESLVHAVINHQPTEWLAIGVVLLVGIIGLVLSLLHYQRKARSN